MTNETKYPNIEVALTGTDGNAFAVVGAVANALRRAGVPAEERDAFRTEAFDGDYANLLVVCAKWVTVL